MLKKFLNKSLPILAILAALGSVAATPVGTLGIAKSTVSIGGYTNNVPDSVVELVVTSGNSGAPRWATYRQPWGSSGYQVPTGKKLVIRVVEVTALGAASNMVIGYGDTDVGTDSNAAPTTPVYVGGTDAVAWIRHNYTVTNDSSKATRIEVPAGKYIFIKEFSGSAWSSRIIGTLEGA